MLKVKLAKKVERADAALACSRTPRHATELCTEPENTFDQPKLEIVRLQGQLRQAGSKLICARLLKYRSYMIVPTVWDVNVPGGFRSNILIFVLSKSQWGAEACFALDCPW
ncbi:hypothetical protein Naga_100178g3 [Nannochloropsis gaditana]|uniref:Uncharacterized protein n=1 Tax=Nannochloropsis gaditana TaxID=72520 RepID=W7T8S6_9STRA|nr:hypothetical protein Naga_100178g3 [Nannochloropsis gaditana]